MNIHRFAITLGILLGAAAGANATNLGFGIGGNNNDSIPSDFGSNATEDGTGYVVSLGGATPNIALIWDSDWDQHHSAQFLPLENQFVGGTPWDGNGTDASIAQMDVTNGFHTIDFFADPGFALVLESFDFAHTAETAGTTEWNLTLTSFSTAEVVWSQTVTFVNGQVFEIAPNFTGEDGESYTLRFQLSSETYDTNGRLGIDNLQFSQVAVPEPGVVALMSFAGLGLVRVLRRRK